MNSDNERPLIGQFAFVTGAGRGIGAAISLKLATMGSNVFLAGRNLAKLEESAGAITKAGGNGLALACDVTNLASVEAAAAQAQSKAGRLDILVNNAGVGGFSAPLHETTPSAWDDIMNTNLRGVFYCMKSFTPLMIASGGGHIVNISSLAGKNALPNGAAYAASKWGLNGLSYSTAEELRSHKIRVSVVCPGSVNTELSPHEGKDVKKMLQPEDVAHAVAMLVTQAPQSFVSEILLRPTQKP